MKITRNETDDLITIFLEGRLDKLSSPMVEEQLKPDVEKCKNITFDFKDLQYISSAGLRILISIQKELKTHGKIVTIINANGDILDILKITGFIYILNVKV